MTIAWKRIRALLLLLAAGTVLAFVDSVQSHLSRAGWPHRDPFTFRFTHMLPPWIIAALLVPAVKAVVRRFPLKWTVRAFALHLAAGAAFALTHFTILALFHHFVLWPGQPVLSAIRLFLVNYFVFYVFVYWAAAGAIQAVESARATRKRRQAAALEPASPESQAADTAPAERMAEARFQVRLGRRVVLVPCREIDWVEGADYYAVLHAGTESHLVRETLQQIEARLDPARFVRVHRSAIVQLDRIRELRARDRAVLLRDGTRIQVSRSRWTAVTAALRIS